MAVTGTVPFNADNPPLAASPIVDAGGPYVGNVNSVIQLAGTVTG